MPEGQEIPQNLETSNKLKAVFETFRDNPKVKIDAALAGATFALGASTGSPEMGALYAAVSLLVRPVAEKIAGGKNTPFAVPGGGVSSEPVPKSTPQLLVEAWKTGVPQTLN